MNLDKTKSPTDQLDQLVKQWNRLDTWPLDIARIEASVLRAAIKKVVEKFPNEIRGHEVKFKNYKNIIPLV